MTGPGGLSHLLHSRVVHAFCGLAFAVALLSWALHGMSPLAVWHAVKQAQFEWLGLGLITFLASYSVRAWRWGTLLKAHCDPGRFGIRHSAVFIGFAGNNLLPAHAGEIVRAALLHRLGGVPLGVALGSILAERVLDIVIVLLFLLVPFLPGAPNQASHGILGVPHLGWIASAILLVCAVIFAAACRPHWIEQLAERGSRAIGLGRLVPRFVAYVRPLLSGLAGLRNPRLAIVALAESLCIWALTGFTFWSGMVAFGIATSGLSGALFVQSVAALGFAIPSSPGSFGPFEAATRLALTLYAIPTDTIVAYTLALHFLMYFSLIAIGLGFAARLGLSWRQLVPQKPALPAQASDDSASPRTFVQSAIGND